MLKITTNKNLKHKNSQRKNKELLKYLKYKRNLLTTYDEKSRP